MRQWLIEELADLPEYRPAEGIYFELVWCEDSFVLTANDVKLDPPEVDHQKFLRRSMGWLAGRRQYWIAYTVLLMATNADLAHWFALRFADELFGTGLPTLSMTFGVPFVRAWLAAQLQPEGAHAGVLHLDYKDGTEETIFLP